MIDNNEQILQKLCLFEQESNKRFYSQDSLYYYSPFKSDSLRFYSYHVIAMTGVSSIQSCAIGIYIPPDEPYCVVENDIIIEFKDNIVDGYQARKINNNLLLYKFCEDMEDNEFIATIIKIKLK